jgi:hypothetical protein
MFSAACDCVLITLSLTTRVASPAEGETLLSAIHKLINNIWNKEELPYQWKESNIVSIDKQADGTD